MKPLLIKIKPARGFTYLLHLLLLALLPIVVYVLVSLHFAPQALAVILLSKWRIFAVRPRFWPAVIRANSVDILVGISILAFMVHSGSMFMQITWTVIYGFWLLVVKPASSVGMVSIQAMISQLFALTALFLVWGSQALYVLVLCVGVICYLAARHFFDSYEEPYAKLLAYVWGYFGAALMWLLGHLLITYPRSSSIIAQPTVFLTAIGYGLAAIYYFDHINRLTKLIRREFIFITIAIVLMLVGSLYYQSLHLAV